MAFELYFAVIHSFEKEQFKKGVNHNKTVIQPLFNPQKPAVIKLVQDIHTLLGKEKNKVFWGQFSDGKREGLFPDGIRKYISSPNDTKIFEDLSKTVLSELIKQADDSLLATGGHILISAYRSEGRHFLLVTSVKEKDGLRLGKNYEPIESANIDFSQIAHAARINIDKFKSYGQPMHLAEAEETDKTYLCFISKGKSDASRYFIEALGCEKGITSARATKKAIDLVYEYFKGNEKLSPFKKPAKEAVIRYLRAKLDSEHEESEKKASLDGIINAAKSAIPAEFAELASEIDSLSDELNSEENQLPQEFTVNRAELNKRIKMKGSTSNWELEFETSALGDTANSSVFYDKDHQTLTLSSIPDDLKIKIEKQLFGEEKNV
ncbi:hypothetical protein PKB_5746 [Pseudomonas knackmussii B13]|uniref:Nucleoid-associated protein n=1 Tax=Pseudomonas knackmussii (strain DSM 6978 / CCUG 54928 / LMG 23759 / B13) TaxID=1301098 RepID=A0A024HQ89_PSEKB|nr:nucleoid-associated protein [Pseudomonas knackmussii]CDF87051.1 hypothetical protein PKB_5746 [Pseudomonas knackmussii B13]